MSLTRRIHPTRYGQLHLRSNEGRGVPLVLLHSSPRSSEMWDSLQRRLARPTYAPDRLGYGFSDAPPWALSVEQYAHSTLDALMAAGVPTPFDVLGIRSGSIEAIEIAAQVPERVRRVILVSVPLLTPEEHQRQSEKYSEQPLKPAAEGGHVLAAWRGCFAFRSPPYDLADVQRRFVEHVLAANPGAALKAASGYALEKRLRALRAPLTVLTPFDDLAEQTARIKPWLKATDVYMELPDLGPDLFHQATERMAELIERIAPA
jgi:pimeloyl-ACP methyl ester carboxylesterase